MHKPIAAICLALLLNSCQNTNNTQEAAATDTTVPDHHNSQIALDWDGIYEATIPCADCPGIKTTVTLKQDNTFIYRAEYLGKNTTLSDSGALQWQKNGSAIHLKTANIDVQYHVGENALMHLDMEGNKIEGELADLYSLSKTQ